MTQGYSRFLWVSGNSCALITPSALPRNPASTHALSAQLASTQRWNLSFSSFSTQYTVFTESLGPTQSPTAQNSFHEVPWDALPPALQPASFSYLFPPLPSFLFTSLTLPFTLFPSSLLPPWTSPLSHYSSTPKSTKFLCSIKYWSNGHPPFTQASNGHSPFTQTFT